MSDQSSAVTGFQNVKARMARAARDAGRAVDAVTLVAVSKTYEAPHILPVLEAGQRVFGENRVQEAKAKWPALRAQFSDVTLHLIGPLQSNKAAEAVGLFDCIETIDRPKIAQAVAAEMTKQGRALELFVQINTGEEPQKAGIAPKEAAAFVRYCRDELKLSIAGLMCIPPAEEIVAPHFALLAKMAKELEIAKLSMGMSSDFECAISLAATHVRVGSAIFGARG
jgi:PLP dependent protein